MLQNTVLLLALFLTACSTIPAPIERVAKADVLAASADMRKTSLGRDFPLHAYIRLNKPDSGKIRLYIEGDGFAYVTRSAPSPEPTPINPTSLRLAAVDSADNVVYMARPCQFNMAAVTQCGRRFWTSERYSRQVIEIVHKAIEDIKSRFDIEQIEVVGYSGGGTIASVLAAERPDIVSLRTVAGNLDIAAFIAHHRISKLPTSVDPATYASELRNIPQLHIVGEYDNIVPITIVDSFLNRQELWPAVKEKRVHVISGMTHYGAWEVSWERILQLPLD